MMSKYHAKVSDKNSCWNSYNNNFPKVLIFSSFQIIRNKYLRKKNGHNGCYKQHINLKKIHVHT